MGLGDEPVAADVVEGFGERRVEQRSSVGIAEPSDRERTNAGLNDLKKMRNKLTSDEEERELFTKPDGMAAWGENQRLAEEAYKKAIEREPGNGKPYRGLGLLCEKSKKTGDAIAAYKKYLDLTPSALDAPRIRTRIESLERKQPQ